MMITKSNTLLNEVVNGLNYCLGDVGSQTVKEVNKTEMILEENS